MKNLQKIRKERGLSQNQLVALSNVSKSLITKYESGERDINKAAAMVVYQLAVALHCPMEDLLEK